MRILDKSGPAYGNKAALDDDAPSLADAADYLLGPAEDEGCEDGGIAPARPWTTSSHWSGRVADAAEGCEKLAAALRPALSEGRLGSAFAKELGEQFNRIMKAHEKICYGRCVQVPTDIARVLQTKSGEWTVAANTIAELAEGDVDAVLDNAPDLLDVLGRVAEEMEQTAGDFIKARKE